MKHIPSPPGTRFKTFYTDQRVRQLKENSYGKKNFFSVVHVRVPYQFIPI